MHSSEQKLTVNETKKFPWPLIRAAVLGLVAYYLFLNLTSEFMHSVRTNSGYEAAFRWEWVLFLLPPVASGIAASLGLGPRGWREYAPRFWLLAASIGPAIAMLDYVIWSVANDRLRAQIPVEVVIVGLLTLCTAIGIASGMRAWIRRLDAVREERAEYIF